MSGNHWTCSDDFEADIQSISDFCDGSVRRDPAPSAHRIKARSKPSLYDDLPEVDDEKPRIFTLGRGYATYTKLNRPGGAFSHFQQELEIARDIREVCGLGFSNDLIERSLRNMQEEDSRCSAPMPNIRLTSAASSSSSSKYSTPTSSPVLSSKTNSPTGSPKHKQGKVTNTNKQSASTGSSNSAPPAIYDIIKREINRSRVPATFTGQLSNAASIGNKKAAFNVNCKTDFPELK